MFIAVRILRLNRTMREYNIPAMSHTLRCFLLAASSAALKICHVMLGTLIPNEWSVEFMPSHIIYLWYCYKQGTRLRV